MIKLLPEDLCIYTSVDDMLIVTNVYKMCLVKIDELIMTSNLIPLNLLEFDVILGMDFLSKCRATMKCRKKEVVFKKSGEADVVFKENRKTLFSSIISTIKSRKLLSKGCTTYLDHVIDTFVTKLTIEDIPVV